MIEFGEKLKHLREEKGMTQQTMAEHLYVTRQAVSRWECGARYPDLLTAKKIAEVLETSIDELVSGEELKRDVGKEPVIMAPVSGFIQTMLYLLGAVCFLIMIVSAAYVNYPRGVALVDLKDNLILYFNTLTEVIVKMAVMFTGTYYSIKNELTPEKISVITSMGFAASLLESMVGSVVSVLSGVQFNPVSLVMWICGIVMIIVVNVFFRSKTDITPLPMYIISVLLLMLYLYTICRMPYGYSEVRYAFTMILVGNGGRMLTAMLLFYQAYVLNKKRKQVNNL